MFSIVYPKKDNAKKEIFYPKKFFYEIL